MEHDTSVSPKRDNPAYALEGSADFFGYFVKVLPEYHSLIFLPGLAPSTHYPPGLLPHLIRVASGWSPRGIRVARKDLV